jgi:hypothetical protein
VSVKQQVSIGLHRSRLLKELLVLWLAHRITYLATHRLGLACSRDYWSCSPRLLTELPVLQTHGVVRALSSLTGLLTMQTHGSAARSAQQQNPRKYVNSGVVSRTSRISIFGLSAVAPLKTEGVFWRKHAERKFSNY